MRLLRLHLKAFGPFTDRVLSFGDGRGLVLVHGPNEAGKSSALRAITDLRFGIPQQSADNFLHPHPQMRVGGEFLDPQGRRHALIRRKGRSNTLSRTDFDDPTAPALEPAGADVEAMLTGGLDREAYETGFGIDHRRLRAGGQALVEGRGEIGSTLFEASAGLRGIGAVLAGLDQTARSHFVPGARGSRGRINEALRQLDESQSRFRQSLVRPAHWSDLARQHRAAAEALATLEQETRELQARARDLAELRAVAPLLAAHDQAAAALEAMRATPLLPDDAERLRATAQSGLASALDDAAASEAEIARQELALERLTPDPAIIELATTVRWLIASADTIDRHQQDAARARAELAAASREARRIASAIAGDVATQHGLAPETHDTPESRDTRNDPEALGALARLVPSLTQRATIDEALRRFERDAQALDQHRQSIAEAGIDDTGVAAESLPDARLLSSLRLAQARVARHAEILERLTTLPAEIDACRRAFEQALTDTGLADETAMRRARPLLDSAIDETANDRLRNATRRDDFLQRLAAVEAERAAEAGRRQALLAEGAVPTRAELEAARSDRDTEWRRLRSRYLGSPGPQGDARPPSELADAYEISVDRADRIADALAADHERAVRLQAIDRTIANLERDARRLRDEIAKIEAGAAAQDTTWNALLADAGLPRLAPAALREWQLRFAALRAAADRLHERQRELDDAQIVSAELATDLHAAIAALAAMGTTPSPGTEARLDTLRALADEVENELRARERRLDTAEGQRRQRQLERERLRSREASLASALTASREALLRALAPLRLADDIRPGTIRARLSELDALSAALERCERALAQRNLASDLLAGLEQSAATMASELGEPPPVELRIFIERLATRLDAAEHAARAEALARQALESAQLAHRRQLATAERHRQTLESLCRDAGVSDIALLAEAEAASRRKRAAQTALEHTLAQLAQASRQSIESLRTRLAAVEPGRIEADETDCARRLADLESQLREAREREEKTRLALRAIDASDLAAAEREQIELLAARVRGELPAWIRARLAHALLGEAVRRFRERAQGPMLRAASSSFATMTGGAFSRLLTDDSDDETPVLVAERTDGTRVQIDGLSEGTTDQLFFALRLAALRMRREAGVDLPVVLDDVLMTSDDDRALRMLSALADFSENGQAIVFTHHRHVVELARARLAPGRLHIVDLADCS